MRQMFYDAIICHDSISYIHSYEMKVQIKVETRIFLIKG